MAGLENLKNRFIMAPIKTGYSDGTGIVTDKHLAFYGERAASLGALTPEPLYMDRALREIPTQIGIDSDDKIEGLKKLTDLLHSTDTKAIAHLNHPGRMANPKIPGNYFISSTDRACENGGATPKRMTEEDMTSVVEMFVSSAKRAEAAGFDFVELQFGHGYLLAQFLSPAVNDRGDEYGGSFENRVRFPLRVFDAVKEAIALPIIVRISGEEMTPDGIRLGETIRLVKLLEERGVSALHVVAGSACSSPPWFFQHMFVQKGKTWEFAREIKSNVSIPVIFVGRINTFDDIDRLFEEYGADYLAVGRALVADPSFVSTYIGGAKGRVKPCLSCSEGCLGGVKSGEGLHCVVNPTVGENELMGKDLFKGVEKPKRIAVVGGGLAGMEVALDLKRKGHSVTLYERDKLGGQFNLAPLPPNKESLSKLIDFYSWSLRDSGIKIINREAREEDLVDGSYNTVILATGSKPVIPPIEGLKNYFWAEILEDQNIVSNKKVLVIGGGLIGVEVANKLLKRNNKVIIVEMLDEIARGMEMIEKALTLKNLKENDVEIYTGWLVSKVERGKVYIKNKEGKEKFFEDVDHIVVATGMRSYNPLEEKIKGKVEYYVIGDAKKVGKAQNAIKDAFDLAIRL